MTETEWLQDPNLFSILDFFERQVSNRRRRLFACACRRRVWELLCSDVARKSLELGELYADGEANEFELRQIHNHPFFATLVPHLWGEAEGKTPLSLRVLHALAAARDLTSPTVSLLQLVLSTSCDSTRDYVPTPQHNEVTGGGGISSDPVELVEKEKLLRDIFGNPFRPVMFDPSWRTEHTVGIARTMYEERNFDAMPILADALRDAGCENDDILNHCLGDGPHVRGCWVVDLVLGKN